MIMHLLAGACVYLVAVSICYLPSVQAGAYYFPIGVVAGLSGQLLWLHLAREVGSKENILVAGFYWDCMLTLMYALVPILFFGVRFSLTTGIGLLLIFAGILVTKI